MESRRPLTAPLRRKNREAAGLVPFEGVFVFIGAAAVTALIAVLLLESVSLIALNAMGGQETCRGLQPGACIGDLPRNARVAAVSPAYQGADWADDLWHEERLRGISALEYSPYRIWQPRRASGKYLNTSTIAGVTYRATPQPNCGEAPRRTVWMLGGGAVWGMGVPDSLTIPALLARELNSAGAECFAVSNFGVEGYNSNQTVQLLLELLGTGQKPDLVVFYGGFEDAFCAHSRPERSHCGAVRIQQLQQADWRAQATTAFARTNMGTLVRRLRGSASIVPAAVTEQEHFVPLRQSADLKAAAQAVLDNFESNVAAVAQLEQAYGFRAYWFWQPTVFYAAKPLHPFERELQQQPEAAIPGTQQVIRAVYDEAKRRAATGRFHFSAGILDLYPEPLYIDVVHLGPRGNQLAAQYVSGAIKQSRKGSRQ